MIAIRTIPIERLRPAPYNPRVPLVPGSPAWQRLERSLREFDLVQPLVWNEVTGHVVGGHQRLEVLKHQGAREVQVAVVSLPLEREQALNVALNNARLGSTWDDDKLASLLVDLADLPEFDETLTGFDEHDLRDLLFVPDPDATTDGDDADADDSASKVRCLLEIDPDDWDTFRPRLDALLRNTQAALHVTFPANGG